jgi:hypothetical protein
MFKDFIFHKGENTKTIVTRTRLVSSCSASFFVRDGHFTISHVALHVMLHFPRSFIFQTYLVIFISISGGFFSQNNNRSAKHHRPGRPIPFSSTRTDSHVPPIQLSSTEIRPIPIAESAPLPNPTNPPHHHLHSAVAPPAPHMACLIWAKNLSAWLPRAPRRV